MLLLGRPGAGKSTELERAIDRGWFNDSEHRPFLRTAKDLGSHQTVRQFLFAGRAWKDTSGHPTTLIIDGLDEILQVNPRFMGEFDAELRDEKADRKYPIRLVLVCRSAEWTGSGVTQLWGKEAFIAAELCQLTQDAATGFVGQCLGDSGQEKFWVEASRLKLNALVVWPHSLGELIREFKLNGCLPQSHFELIRRAARRRCDLSSPWDRGRAERIGKKPDPKWMFRLVGRVAAVSIFTGELAVDTQDWEHSEEAEPWKGNPRLILPEDLDELRYAGHFDLDKEGCLVFQHQIFREHMAAAWLAERELTSFQLRQLFGSKRDGVWRHYPQLATVAAWLASDPSQIEWRQFLIKLDPMVLLRADAMQLPDQDKLDIAGALLKQARTDGWVDQGVAHHAISSLACDGLAEIVEPYLDDMSLVATAARDLAITITIEARLTSLVPKLWQFVKASDEPLRIHIAHALRILAAHDSIFEWEAVFDEMTPSDEHGILLGAALEYLIPKYKKISNALHLLLPARDFHIFGDITFAGAAQRLPAKVTDDDILPILERSERNFASGFGDGYSGRETILSAAMRLLGRHLSDPVYMEAFARWWFARLTSHSAGPEWKREAPPEHSTLDFFGINETLNQVTLDDLGFNEVERRHAFLCAFAGLSRPYNITSRDARYAAMHVTTFVHLPDDIPWLIERLDQHADDEDSYWAAFLSDAYYRVENDPTQKSILQQAFDRHAVLRAMLPAVPSGKSVFEHLDDRAEDYRREREQISTANQNRFKSIEAAREDDLKHDRELAQRLTAAGDPASWIALTRVLSAKSSSLTPRLVNEAKIGKPWMREAARLYLLQPSPLPFPGPSNERLQFHLRFATTWAVYTLWDEISADAQLRPAVVGHWLPYVFSAMAGHGCTDDDFSLGDVLSKFGGDGTIAYLAMLAHNYAMHDGMWNVRHLENAWSDLAGSGLADLLRGIPPEPQGFAETLEFLARHDQIKAREVADYWLNKLPMDASNEASLTLMAALLVSLPGYRWDEYGIAAKASPETARAVLMQAFGRIGLRFADTRRLADFPDEFLADLVELMFTIFSPERDPASFRQGGGVSSLDETLYARDALFSQVQERGMIGVVHRLQDLKIPGTERWFSFAASKAQGTRQAAGWQPMKQSDLLALARQNYPSFARNQDEFLDAVMLEVRRYGEAVITERVSDIWIRTKKEAHHEEEISERLKIWLKDHLKILPSREAQTERGKKTDIEVSLPLVGSTPLHTTIEVKKSDRENLLDGMETQLLDDYLRARGRTHGLYVVFWLRDGERKNHPGITTAAELQARLDDQARRLSTGGFQIRALVFDCNLPSLPAGLKKNASRRRAPVTSGPKEEVP